MRSAQGLAAAGVMVALALVFMAYTRPDFVMAMANQVWACF